MRKLNVILASTLVIGAIAVNAQDSGTSGSQERTGAATQDRSGAGVGKQGQSNSNDQTGAQGQSGAQGEAGSQGANPTQGATGSHDYQKDMIVVKSSEVPPSLRTTLGDSRYKGWENGSTIYKTRSNDQFVVEMRDGNNTKVHRFDKEGKLVQGQD